jgi:hypothetical protein
MAAKKERVRHLEAEPRLEDFGGDPIKMALQKAIDAGRPQTRIRFTFKGEAEKEWRRRKDLPPAVVAVNLARMYEAGEIQGQKDGDGTVHYETSDPSIVLRVAELAAEYRAKRPVGRDEALKVLQEGRGRLAFLQQVNSSLDFGPAKELAEEAQILFNAHALKKDADLLNYRPVVEKARAAVKAAEDLVANEIAASIRRMGAADAEERLAEAMALQDLQERRNALLALRRLLVGMGYSDPMFATSREAANSRRQQPARRGQPPNRFAQKRTRF